MCRATAFGLDVARPAMDGDGGGDDRHLAAEAVHSDVAAKALERPRRRLDGDDPSARALTGEPDTRQADVRADVDDRRARPQVHLRVVVEPADEDLHEDEELVRPDMQFLAAAEAEGELSLRKRRVAQPLPVSIRLDDDAGNTSRVPVPELSPQPEGQLAGACLGHCEVAGGRIAAWYQAGLRVPGGVAARSRATPGGVLASGDAPAPPLCRPAARRSRRRRGRRPPEGARLGRDRPHRAAYHAR